MQFNPRLFTAKASASGAWTEDRVERRAGPRLRELVSSWPEIVGALPEKI